MDKYHSPLVADNYYHVFNRAIGREKLFISTDDYEYFLQKLKCHTLPVADIFAYSLLPNHFHLVMRINSQDILAAHFQSKKRKPFDALTHDISDFNMERFSNWLNGYTKFFNNKYDRKGGLFIDYTKRIEAKSDADITSFILYTHQNAVHHRLRKEIGQWPYDSYQEILGRGPTFLMRTEMIEWFGSAQRFEEFHKQPVHPRTYKILRNLIG